jgi:hypothetical protein
MSKFEVTRYEIHRSIMEVEAESQVDALQKVTDGDGDEVSFEYVRLYTDGEPLTIKEVEVDD